MKLPFNRPSAIALPPKPKGLSQQMSLAGVANPVFSLSNENGRAVIRIFEEIGHGGVTAKALAGMLAEAGSLPVTLQVNSPGGEVWEGVAMYNLLREHRQPVRVEVMSVAASAASVLIMAAEDIRIARNARLMIHCAWIIALGNADGLREAADLLEQIDGDLARTYAERSGQGVDPVMAMMKAETWMSADQAVELGFADRLLDREADPEPVPANRATCTPQSKRDLERSLRELGFAKAAATAIAAGGYAALSGTPQDEEWHQLAREIETIRAEILKG
ncbi:ClpP protease [Glycocaulis alkaliphilus]|uniref:ATP-dependent Clp protease proteolytic subunit n=1 Tax=Glycocaulis alkaliphilus TaxID=1434191 RepID=A0A3T0E9J5_9PROT|nr:head maturation protease, ClpP-related [Glycocaulis alkaliphilus]AZU04103.1 ClpP protease [Glycocaulis alkaliphilus]